MSWILLIIGGLFEVGFASCLGKAMKQRNRIYLLDVGFYFKYKYATAV
jgi:quaternary ammonium compound-resistance protein SugE